MADEPEHVDANAEEIPDADVVGEEEPRAVEPPPSRELELHAAAGGSTALIRGDDPEQILETASRIAKAFKSVVEQQQLSTRIGNKDHVEIEAWQTLATLLGCAPIVRWSRRVIDPETGKPEKVSYDVHVKDFEWVTPDGGGKKQKRLKAERDYTVEGYNWEAYCEVVKDGVIIATAESMTSRTEDKWAQDPDFALRSMAQTRAQSRAIAAAARWVTVLAGYSGTPAEEMTHVDPGDQGPPPFARRGSEQLEKVAKQALVAVLNGDRAAAGTVWEQIVKSAVNGGDGEEIGYVPRVVAQAIVLVATGIVEKRTAGTVEIGTPSDEKPNRVTEEKAQELCRCPEGFDAAQQDEKKRSGDCPIAGHGIPF